MPFDDNKQHMPQEVDAPWELDMSELCLSEGFSRNMRDNGTGKIMSDSFILLLAHFPMLQFHPPPIHHCTFLLAFLASCLAAPSSLNSLCIVENDQDVMIYITKLNKSTS
jgi:hypothetical protein